MNSIIDIVESQHHLFRSGKTSDINFRINQLKKLKRILKENEVEIFEALKSDFNKPEFESFSTEIGILYNEINYATKNVSSWAKPRKVRDSVVTFPSSSYIHYQPYGVVLVIGAWNYPVLLALQPTIGAIAAGNTVIVKPSEVAKNSSSIIEYMINNHFDPGYLCVIEGDADETKKILSQPLDYIFFTGSTRVGKSVMRNAAEQLTPLTLELGGKSPAIVDESADIDIAAKRITWGKFLNAGQTCVAPDYLYVHAACKDDLISRITHYIQDFYGTDPGKSPDYPRIIDDKHFDRLVSLLDNGRVITGGTFDKVHRYIAPTIIDKISWDDPIMAEEIFGPILPILSFRNFNKIVKEINQRPAPLSLYLFSANAQQQEQIVTETKFGGGCINDTIFHLGNKKLPFGGIGDSGFGRYHGEHSFQLFSYQKSVFKRSSWIDIPLRYPPYKNKMKWLKMIFR